jgi:hypothetical protein
MYRMFPECRGIWTYAAAAGRVITLGKRQAEEEGTPEVKRGGATREAGCRHTFAPGFPAAGS